MIKYDDKDHYCMDGQRLIEISEDEYRTQIESYSKIIRVGNNSNPKSFNVMTKSGDIYTYATVEKLNSKNTTWLLSKIKDRLNNSINFHYSNDNNPKRITSIDYSEKHNLIVFNYTNRQNPILGYRYGKNISLSKQLSSIRITSNNKLFRNYKFSYTSKGANFERLKLASIQECNSKGECTSPLQFSWQNEKKIQPTFSSTAKFPNFDAKNQDMIFADLNGDGFVDIFYKSEIWINNKYGNFSFNKKISLNSKNARLIDIDSDGDIDIYDACSGNDNIWINDGKGNFSLSSSHPNVHASREKIFFTDIDNDGDIDIYSWDKNKAYLVRNEGHGRFSSRVKINDNMYASAKVAFSDLNGDGYIDIIHTFVDYDYYGGDDSYGFEVLLNNGDNTFRKEYSKETQSNRYATKYLGDFNGDGIVDVLIISSKNWKALGVQSKLYTTKNGTVWKEKTIDNLIAKYLTKINVILFPKAI